MEKPLNLLRWFSLLSLICITLISAASAALLSSFLTEKILWREAVISKDFIEGIVKAENTWSYFVLQNPGETGPVLESFFNHVANMPGVVRANVYASDRTMLWSSDSELVGERFLDNEELEESLAGQLTVESGIVGATEKSEHTDLEPQQIGLRFIETYVPIIDHDRKMVVGSVELYKVPRELQLTIKEGNRLVWTSATVGGLLLYATLFWIVRGASLTMRVQQQRLLESESLTMIGETTSAIVHSIRNPLASIRSCAELTLTDDLEGARESANDILRETDRVDQWARDLLQFSRVDSTDPENVELNDVITTSVIGLEPAMERQGIALTLNLQESLPAVRGNTTPLGHVLSSLVTNAIEAMLDGGDLQVTSRFDAKRDVVEVVIADTGPGLSAEMKEKIFRPFFSTKASGTGLGLALSRRIVEHYGGTLGISSVEGRGVTVTLRIPVAG